MTVLSDSLPSVVCVPSDYGNKKTMIAAGISKNESP
jgi:hypothetical protein